MLTRVFSLAIAPLSLSTKCLPMDGMISLGLVHVGGGLRGIYTTVADCQLFRRLHGEDLGYPE